LIVLKNSFFKFEYMIIIDNIKYILK